MLAGVRRQGVLIGLLLVAAALLGAAPAMADDWWPHPPTAQWHYTWSDSTYSQGATKEKVTVQSQQGRAFTLAWNSEGQQSSTGSGSVTVTPDSGIMSFAEQNFGV